MGMTAQEKSKMERLEMLAGLVHRDRFERDKAEAQKKIALAERNLEKWTNALNNANKNLELIDSSQIALGLGEE